MIPTDVAVIGGGNAGLCAAIAAAREGARVTLVERAPLALRGGNSWHTRDIRHAHAEAVPTASGSYPEEEFLADLAGVSDTSLDPALAHLIVQESAGLPAWMSGQGIHWQPQLTGTLHLSRTNSFFLGGGKALVNTYYGTAERLGVRVLYGTALERVDWSADATVSLRLAGEVADTLEARAVVLAAGGYEASLPRLRVHWGSAANNYIVRGSPYNDGQVLYLLIDAGARTVGDPKAFHAVAVDARSPKFDGGIVTRVDATPYGIVVNVRGKRFYDEGEDLWPKRYAIWGRLIAEQPQQSVFVLFDESTRRLFIPSIYPPLRADSIPRLAAQLDADQDALVRTVREFNDHTDGSARFDPHRLDGVSTRGLDPPKSNWALPIAQPPFYAYPLRPGITFTYRGLKVDGSFRVLRETGPLPGVFAAGEIMAGNVLTRGYLAGIGLTIGTTSGIHAGQEAARHAR